MTKMPADHSPTPANPQGETASVPAKASATALTKVADTALSKRALALPPAHNAATWSARQPIWTGIATVALLIAFFGGWGMLTTISGAVVAPGVVQVEQNRQVVQHPDGGVVAEIAVQEAQTVTSGDLLIRLDGAQIKASLAIVEGQLFDAMARKARLEVA
jgi:HlyD family secretion protein